VDSLAAAHSQSEPLGVPSDMVLSTTHSRHRHTSHTLLASKW
jgi:hypothetical protein